MNEQQIIDTIKSGSKKLIVAGVAALIGFCSFGYNDSGVSLRLQQPFLGVTWIKEEGFYGKLPFVSKTRAYNQKGTVVASDSESIIDSASLANPPSRLQFADSYEMHIEWSMRYSIPIDDDGLEKMHKDLKSEGNLLGNTVMPFAQTLVNDSVNQMLGGDFAQGGRNGLRTLIDNQSQYGMYQTKVTKVSAGKTSGAGSNAASGSAIEDLEITEVVYIMDAVTKKRARTPLSIAQYGIKIVPNSIAIIDAQPLGRLVQYIDTKQLNIKKQIEQDEKQKFLSKQTYTEKLQGEKDLVSKTNVLNIRKQEAIIAAEQRVEEAKLQATKETVERQKVADLAIIDKERELQVAEANEGIQRANATAAKHQASAIKLVGFAQAAVKKADYAAIDKAILTLEVDKAKALALYKSNMVVNMPTIMSQGSNANGTDNSISQMSSLKLMEQLGTTVAGK